MASINTTICFSFSPKDGDGNQSLMSAVCAVSDAYVRISRVFVKDAGAKIEVTGFADSGFEPVWGRASADEWLYTHLDKEMPRNIEPLWSDWDMIINESLCEFDPEPESVAAEKRQEALEARIEDRRISKMFNL